MTKVGGEDWRTPLGVYERALNELRNVREEIFVELQNLRANQTSQVELETLKLELQNAQTELQELKKHQAITQQTANEAQSKVVSAERAVLTAQEELKMLKVKLQNMSNQSAENNERVIEELSQIKQQLAQLQQLQTESITGNQNLPNQTFQSLSDLRSQVSKLVDELTLISSATGTDYRQLRDLLLAGEWEKADRETHSLMCRVSNREREGWRWLDRGEIERFPWQDLRIINQLWVEYSQACFGFSIQKQIWQSVTVVSNNDFEVEKTLGDRVGWRVSNNWINYEQFNFSLSASKGHLPSTLHLLGLDKGKVEDRIRFFLSRRDL